jgi:hypothetical protein
MKGRNLYGLAVEMKKVPKEVVVEGSGDSKAVEVSEAFRTKDSKEGVRMQQAASGKGWGTNASNKGQPCCCKTQGRGLTPYVCFTCKGNARRCVLVFNCIM